MKDSTPHEGKYSLSQAQSTAFDIIRALSAQFVLIGHAISSAGFETKIAIQDFGVILFFILSGYLITNSVMRKTSEYTFMSYFIDRATRIFVPLIPSIFFIVLCGIIFDLKGPIDVKTVLLNLTLLNDYIPLIKITGIEIDRVGTGRPLWSVSYEWWFYMGASLFYFAKNIPIYAWLLVFIGFLSFIFNGTLVYIWLISGALVLILPHANRNLPWLALCTILACCIIWRLLVVGGEFYDLQLNLLLIALIGSTLLLIEKWNWLGIFQNSASFFAGYSYTLYLTHYTVMSIIDLSGKIHIFLTFVCSNIVAIILWYLFESRTKTISRALKAKLKLPS